MSLTRRSFVTKAAAAAGEASLLIAAGAALSRCQQGQTLSDPRVEGNRIGPSPLSPGLFRNSRRFLFTDGTIMTVDSFCLAVIAYTLARRGLARAIPQGIALETEEQKLWLLGRKSFVPRYEKNSSDLLSGRRPDAIRSG